MKETLLEEQLLEVPKPPKILGRIKSRFFLKEYAKLHYVWPRNRIFEGFELEKVLNNGKLIFCVVPKKKLQIYTLHFNHFNILKSYSQPIHVSCSYQVFLQVV